MTSLKYLKDQVILIDYSPEDNRTDISIRLAQAGVTIVINTVDSKKAEEIINKYKKNGIKVFVYSFDTTNKVVVKEKIQMIEKEIGPIKMLINMPETYKTLLTESFV